VLKIPWSSLDCYQSLAHWVKWTTDLTPLSARNEDKMLLSV
jgi:hypothetical protein